MDGTVTKLDEEGKVLSVEQPTQDHEDGTHGPRHYDGKPVGLNELLRQPPAATPAGGTEATPSQPGEPKTGGADSDESHSDSQSEHQE